MRIKRCRMPVCVGFLIAFLCQVGPVAWAQAVANATVTGRIVDPQGAIVPGVQITVIGTDTGAVHRAVTNNEGLYTLSNLPVGSYSLEATDRGFQTYAQRGIVLQINDIVQINVTLTVGQVTDRIEVQADTATVQTQQTNISQVIDGRRIAELPLNGRDRRSSSLSPERR